MPTQRRWLKSVIAAAAQPLPALPWERKPQPGAAAAPAAPASAARHASG